MIAEAARTARPSLRRSHRPKERLTLTRHGVFDVPNKSMTATHCGPDGSNKFYYRVSLRTSGDYQLDDRGFLMDTADVDKVFDPYRRGEVPFASCESMAQQIAERFWAATMDSNGNTPIGEVKVVLMPMEPPTSGHTVEFEYHLTLD